MSPFRIAGAPSGGGGAHGSTLACSRAILRVTVPAGARVADSRDRQVARPRRMLRRSAASRGCGLSFGRQAHGGIGGRMDGVSEALLEQIRGQNLGVYRASPVRVREDVTQEEQIAGDYRGRLLYELLQNADDAMLASGGLNDRILFRLTDDDLFVANSGRPLTEGDVIGLCGTGAGTKAAQRGNRRASIGHKGMGFKSVLEITDAPEVRSTVYGFAMDRGQATAAVTATFAEMELAAPDRVPVMRFPWAVELDDPDWHAARAQGYNVLFRFPLHDRVTTERRRQLATRLLGLPVTAILFLKHLERVDVEVDTSENHERVSWSVTRERRVDGAWESCAGLERSGFYRIRVRTERPGMPDTLTPFLVAHDADVPIGAHRAGLVGYAWEGIEFTEVSVATPWPTGTADDLPSGWARFHVFLPTGEHSPYPLVVNGAFSTDLSRQEIRIGVDPEDYNRHLLERAAALFRDQLVGELLAGGGRAIDVLEMLDRARVGQASPIGDALHAAMRAAMADLAFLETESGGTLAISGAVVPPTTGRTTLGSELRALLAADFRRDDRAFPAVTLCGSEAARVLVDLGARELSAVEAVNALAGVDPNRSRARIGLGGSLQVDPVLAVLEGLLDVPGARRADIARAAQANALFPVALDADGVVTRIRSEGLSCFYPPRSLAQRVPLDGLAFMARALCWGELIPKERNELLRAQMSAWQALFDVREFKFPDVMRASVLPSLDLPSGNEVSEGRRALEDVDRLGAICQLAGRTPNPGAPLPFERLGPNRALFNLSRLPVPCVGRDGQGERWLPAYRAYFGRAWTGDASIEDLAEALRVADAASSPDIPILAGPARLAGTLARYAALAHATAEEETDEVDIAEDDEAPLEADEQERWLRFFTWIGVNRVLRPISFHDVEDRGSGWLSTGGLAQPEGHAFRGLGKTWTSWRDHIADSLPKTSAEGTWYLYEVHDLEWAGLIPAAAKAHFPVSSALYEHLARNWDVLGRFQVARGAFVPSDRSPGMRSVRKPAGDEERDLGENLWLHRLRRVSWVPTSHGARQPARAWLPSTELTRRFGRHGSSAPDLIPIVTADRAVLEGRTRGLAAALRIREDFSPSSFREGDARALLERIEFLYAQAADAGSIGDETLRHVIRPAYRNLVELLSGRVGDDEDSSAVEPTLGDADVLVHDGAGSFRFVPARSAYYMARSGTRERLNADAPIWTLVNEASLTARKPLRLLGIRVLEDELHWDVVPGRAAFEDEAEEERFRAGVRSIAPFILARLRADRADERLATLDGGRLRRLLAVLEPVRDVVLTCSLDGTVVSRLVRRDGFVEFAEDRSVRAYVRWGERGWPPGDDEAEALAGVFVDTFGAGALEAFLALIRARSDETRYRLLSLAGAPLDLAEVWESGTGLEDQEREVVESAAPRPSDDASAGDELTDGAVGGAPVSAPLGLRTPLYRVDDLLIDGVPVPVVGPGPRQHAERRHERGAADPAHNGQRAGFGGRTDLTELDRLGMHVAMGFERLRLRRAGCADALMSSEVDGPSESLRVFDVSTAAAAERAWELSAALREAFKYLESQGVHRWFPGFDILTLAADDPGRPDRMIELKSSGLNARTQTMTWNEWKSAKASSLRERFYLYLVGNLRTDLGAAAPFLRAIHDPFSSLWAREVEDASVHRSIQLNVLEFATAEELVLSVRAAPQEGSAAGPV